MILRQSDYYTWDLEQTYDDDKEMIYSKPDKRYYMTVAGANSLLNINLSKKLKGDKEADNFVIEQCDNVMRDLLASMYNPDNTDAVEFKIGRTERGRAGIKKAYLSQIRWALRFYKDMLEEGISPNAKTELRNAQLWKKGKYQVFVDPDQKDVGY